MPMCVFSTSEVQVFQAMRKEGLGAVLPGHLLRHLIYETAWLLGTGLPRKLDILTGREKLKFDPAILMEGFKHHTRCHSTVEYYLESWRQKYVRIV